MFIGLTMCFNIGSVDAIRKVKGKYYMASQMMIMQLPKGWIHIKNYFLKCFVNLLVRNIQMQLITL